MKKLVLLSSIVFLMVTLVLSAVVFASQSVDLLAGQDVYVGSVSIWNDSDWLYVKYETVDGWSLKETHLHVATSLDGIPQKRGNPPPGQFDYQNDYDPSVTEDTYEIDLDGITGELFIAAHAVVQKTTIITETPYYASVVVDSYQGEKKDGNPVRSERSDPDQGLVFETGRDEHNFFSLGFGGWIILEFDCPIQNGEGNDVKIIEDTWGTYPLETANVSASQDGNAWYDLGEADNLTRDVLGIHTISEFDLGSLGWAEYIKVEDTTDPVGHNNSSDGYDLNAVEVLHDCVEIEEETAWGDGGHDFSGSNWATYITYTVQ